MRTICGGKLSPMTTGKHCVKLENLGPLDGDVLYKETINRIWGSGKL